MVSSFEWIFAIFDGCQEHIRTEPWTASGRRLGRHRVLSAGCRVRCGFSPSCGFGSVRGRTYAAHCLPHRFLCGQSTAYQAISLTAISPALRYLPPQDAPCDGAHAVNGTHAPCVRYRTYNLPLGAYSYLVTLDVPALLRCVICVCHSAK